MITQNVLLKYNLFYFLSSFTIIGHIVHMISTARWLVLIFMQNCKWLVE